MKISKMSDADIVCSSLQHLLKEVISAKIGICAREIELVQLSTGKPALDKKVNVAIDDRFKLKIPVSDQYMTWEVMFNCSLPNCPPDFELNDIDFFYSVTIDCMEELLPSLKQWDHRKNKALINVISELRSAYLKYQVEKLKTIDNQCAYEYSAMIEEGRFSDDQVEVLIDCNVAHFLIRLNVTLPNNLPEGDYMIVLALRWGEHTRSSTLVTSPDVVDHITNLQVPRNFNYNESLLEYVDEVTKSVESQIKTLLMKRKDKRKEFVFHILKFMGHSLISYDAMEYTNCCLLLEKDGFVCILEIRISTLFPSKPPQYRLMSVYSTSKNGQPLSQVIQVPFTDSWDVPTMIQQAISCIKGKKMQVFKDATRSTFKLCK